MNLVFFIPYKKSITCEKTVKLLFDHVFCYHGLSEDIVFIVNLNLHPSSGSGFLSY
jgi:hypothetical protein